jgi:hypothetical protein
MTQAFNLAQFANKVNTSGQVDASTALTNAVPVANGGTGATTLAANNVLLGNGTTAVQVVAPGTAGNVLTSNGTTWTSVGATGVNSFNTRIGAVTLTNADVLTANASSAVGAVGTYALMYCASALNPGDTIAGSSLNYSSAGSQASGVTVSGTWRCMGRVNPTGSASDQVSLFLRIA